MLLGSAKTAFWILVLFALPASMAFGADRDLGDIKHWPKSIRHVEDSEGKAAFIVSGIYRDEERWNYWSDKGNWLMWKLKKFAATDSLAVDTEKGEARFYTQKSPEELLGVFRTISIFSGFVPTMSELRARDYQSSEFDPGYFEVKARYDIQGVGRIVNVPCVGQKSELRIRFVQSRYTPFQSNATYELIVAGKSDRIEFTMCAADSIPYSLLAAYEYSTPNFAEGEFIAGEVGVAKLNETREHCKGHMEHALRIYNREGEYIWFTEDGLHGARGVWSRDLNGDGAWELLVLADDHGSRRLVVYGRAD